MSLIEISVDLNGDIDIKSEIVLVLLGLFASKPVTVTSYDPSAIIKPKIPIRL
jgi:hypothetical protein